MYFGQKFGELMIVANLGGDTFQTVCSCNSILVVTGKQLKMGEVENCGCKSGTKPLTIFPQKPMVVQQNGGALLKLTKSAKRAQRKKAQTQKAQRKKQEIKEGAPRYLPPPSSAFEKGKKFGKMEIIGYLGERTVELKCQCGEICRYRTFELQRTKWSKSTRPLKVECPVCTRKTKEKLNKALLKKANQS